jgi:hypothetical protein
MKSERKEFFDKEGWFEFADEESFGIDDSQLAFQDEEIDYHTEEFADIIYKKMIDEELDPDVEVEYDEIAEEKKN